MASESSSRLGTQLGCVVNDTARCEGPQIAHQKNNEMVWYRRVGMRCRLGLIAALSLHLVACQFPLPPDVEAPIDAAPLAPDATPGCEPNTQVCVAGRFTQCGPDGRYASFVIPNGAPGGTPREVVLSEYECPMGCHPTEARCADVVPSNGLMAVLDSQSTSLDGLDVILDDTSGDNLIRVTDGAPNGQVAVVKTAGGEALFIPAEVVTQPNGPDIVVLKTRSFTIKQGVTLKLTGTKAVAIVAHLDILIAGNLDLSGTVLGAGASHNETCNVGFAAGPRGGGGNYYAGGAASDGSPGGTSLSTSGPGLIPLEGGCSSYLGVGGGAIQLVSRTRPTTRSRPARQVTLIWRPRRSPAPPAQAVAGVAMAGPSQLHPGTAWVRSPAAAARLADWSQPTAAACSSRQRVR